MKLILAILEFFFPKKLPVEMEYVPITVIPLPPEPLPPKPEPIMEDWNTAKSAYRATRILCDFMGVPYKKTYLIEGRYFSLKDIICACIYQESGFKNYKSEGNPTMFQNKANGVIWSTDWGIAQINDHKGWHIGPGLYFSSVQDVLANPQKAVRYMILMALAGRLSLWSSYKFKDYVKHLRPGSPMWDLAVD